VFWFGRGVFFCNKFRSVAALMPYFPVVEPAAPNPSPNGLFLMIFGHFRGLKLLFPGVSHWYEFAYWNGF